MSNQNVNTVTTVVTKNKHVHFQNFVFPILFPIDFAILTFSLFNKKYKSFVRNYNKLLKYALKFFFVMSWPNLVLFNSLLSYD